MTESETLQRSGWENLDSRAGMTTHGNLRPRTFHFYDLGAERKLMNYFVVYQKTYH